MILNVKISSFAVDGGGLPPTHFIPVAIVGAWEAKKKTDWKLKPGIITIHYGKPIKSSDYNNYTIQDLSNRVKNELQKLISEG